MIGDITMAGSVYVVTGYTDMRKSIDGLCSIISDTYRLDPRSRSLFLFCGKRRDRIKLLLWEGDGFVLLYKRLSGTGSFKWPRDKNEARSITWKQLDWLLSGLKIDQKGIITKA